MPRRVNQLWALTFVVFLCISWGTEASVPSFELDGLAAKVEKGRAEISKLRDRAALPHGSCWKSALEDLQVGCRDMIPETQSRLALQFTMCYNELLGFSAIICGKSTPLQECMKNLDSNSQSTFREFFLHTQDMCYFIEHQLWQERTSNAVNDVTHAVIDVTKNLEEAKETQERVLKSQQESLIVQGNIKKDNSEIYNMVLNVKDVFEEVQASSVEQRQVVVEVFDKLSKMQKLVSWIQGEMSLLDMMGFYFASILFVYFGSSSKRTQNSRFWLMLLMIFTIAAERSLNIELNSKGVAPEEIQEWVWIFRRCTAVLGVIIVVCTAACYRDPQTIQQNWFLHLENKVDGMVEQFEQFFQAVQSGRIPLSAISGEIQNHNPAAVENGQDSDSDTFSDYSDESEIEQAEVDYITSRQKPVDSEYNDENKVPETASPVSPVQSNVYGHVHNQFRKEREQSVDRSTLNESRHGYNLRTRNVSVTPSPLLQRETVTQFAKQVKYPNRRNITYYSSDDEI